MLKRILTAVLMLFVLLVVNSAGASNTVRIAYSDIDNFVGIKDGRLAGYGVALFDAIAEHTGWTYEYKSGSWEQCLEWVKNGEADFTFPAQYSEQRAVDFLFSRQNCILDFAAIYTSGTNSDILYQDYQSLQGKRLGMIKGNYLNLCFDKFVGSKGISVQKFYYSSGAEVNEALAAGKIDAIMSGNCVLDEDKKLVAKFDYLPAYIITGKKQYGINGAAGSGDAGDNAGKSLFYCRVVREFLRTCRQVGQGVYQGGTCLYPDSRTAACCR